MNTINTTFIWLAIFILAVVIATLYNEIKELKSRVFWDRAYRPDPITHPFSAALIEQKNEEIKNLKAELNKVKFDYACEVAGKK